MPLVGALEISGSTGATNCTEWIRVNTPQGLPFTVLAYLHVIAGHWRKRRHRASIEICGTIFGANNNKCARSINRHRRQRLRNCPARAYIDVSKGHRRSESANMPAGAKRRSCREGEKRPYGKTR